MKRCFIAVKIPAEPAIRNFLLQLKNSLSSSRINWVDPGSLHLTFAFLGDLNEQQIKLTSEILRLATEACPPVDIEIKGLGSFGSRQNPTVIWMGIKASENLFNLQSRLDKDLKVIGYVSDHKIFHPHLTLGRIKSFNDKQNLDSYSEKNKDTTFLKFLAKSVILFESKLSQKGPEYSVISEFALQA